MMEVEGLVAGYGRIGVLDEVSLAVGAGRASGSWGITARARRRC